MATPKKRAANKLSGHKKQKKFVDYSKKYGKTYQDILDIDYDVLMKTNKETLRHYLLILNQEVNKRLERWAETNKKDREKLEVKDMKDRLAKGGEEYRRYSTWYNMNKKEILNELVDRNILLSKKTSSVEGANKVKEERDKLLKQKIFEATGLDYDEEVEAGRVGVTLEDFGKVLNKLRDDHYLGAKAQTSGSSLGSPTVMKEAFTMYKEGNFTDINQLYDDLVKKLKKKREEIQRNQARERKEEASKLATVGVKR